MHVLFSQVRKRMCACPQPLAAQSPARARTPWCAVVTEGCVLCLRLSLKIQLNCEFLLLVSFICLLSCHSFCLIPFRRDCLSISTHIQGIGFWII